MKSSFSCPSPAEIPPCGTLNLYPAPLQQPDKDIECLYQHKLFLIFMAQRFKRIITQHGLYCLNGMDKMSE
jgi:hypothetical protein